MRSLVLATLVLLAWAGLPVPVNAATKNAHISCVVTPSGKCDTNYLDGNDAAAAAGVSWPASIANISVANGSTGSFDFSTLGVCTGGSCTNTLSCLPSLPTGGFTYSGSTLSYSSTTATSLNCTATRTKSGNSAISTPFQIVSFVQTATTVAPTVPTGCKAIAGPSTNQLTLSCDKPYDGSEGVKDIQFKVSGSVVATATTSAGTPRPLSTANIGTSTPAPVVNITLDGTSVSQVARGTGIEGNFDSFSYVYTPVSRPFTATVKLLTSTNGAYAKAAFEVRNSTDPQGAAFNCGDYFDDAGNHQIQVRVRPTAGGTRFNAQSTPVAAPLPFWLQIQGAADGTWSCAYSLNGNTFSTAIGPSYSLPLAATVNVGLAVTSSNPDAANSVTWSNLAITDGTTVSTTYSTASAVTLCAQARDLAGTPNVSACGANFVGTPFGVTPSGAKKWHPGHYIGISPGSVNGIPGSRFDLAGVRSQISSVISEVCANSYVRGIMIFGIWKAFEGDVAGDYSPGFSAIDALKGEAAACGKKIILSFWTTYFGQIGNNTDIFPAYLINGPQYGLGGIGFYSSPPGSAGKTSRYWQTATMDRLIAIDAAYAARYDADPAIEMWEIAADGLQAVDPDYSVDGLSSQQQRRMTAAKAVWAKTQLRLSANYFGSDAQMCTLLRAAEANGFAIGGPDIDSTHIITANMVFAGATCGFDYRQKVPFVAEFQAAEFPVNTISQMFSVSMNGYTVGSVNQPKLSPQYFVWRKQDWQGTDQQKWPAVLSLINAQQGKVGDGSTTTPISPASVACPTDYASCDTTP